MIRAVDRRSIFRDRRPGMQMVKIQIPDREECAKGFAALIRRGRVDCFRDNVFIVPEPALEVLQTLGVRYLELGRARLDDAQKGLRDSAAPPT
jgi:hypothetical protein